MTRIYLDYNAGVPLRLEARAAMAGFIETEGANPGAVHLSGQKARRALESARAQVAALIGARDREVIFCSGGTEANNLAIFGAAGALPARRKIVTTAIEHSSILHPLEILQPRGYEIVRLKPDRDGIVPPGAVLAAIDRNTALVSVGLANAEVGTIQGLAPLAEPIRHLGALLHVDAAQAAGRIPLDAPRLGCDLMTLSAAKLGGPGGIGALYVRAGLNLMPSLFGGPQERGMRAGTQNTLGAVGFGAAAGFARVHLEEEAGRVGRLANTLLRRLLDAIPGLRLNGPNAGRINNTLNLTFPGVLGESMLIALDLEGVEVSMGSACAAGSVEPSHVLLAMGREAAEARSSLRLSLGWGTSEGEVERAALIIPAVWSRVMKAEPAADARAVL